MIVLVDRRREALKTRFTHFETLLKLLLLLVNDTESEVDLVCLLEVGLHAHDLREGFLGVLQRAVAIVQDTNAIPKLRLFGVRQVVQGLLVGRVGLLQIVHHEVTMAQAAPDLSIRGLDDEDVPEVLDGGRELVLGAQDT